MTCQAVKHLRSRCGVGFEHPVALAGDGALERSTSTRNSRTRSSMRCRSISGVAIAA